MSLWEYFSVYNCRCISAKVSVGVCEFIYMYMCVCVRECMRACVRACVVGLKHKHPRLCTIGYGGVKAWYGSVEFRYIDKIKIEKPVKLKFVFSIHIYHIYYLL